MSFTGSWLAAGFCGGNPGSCWISKHPAEVAAPFGSLAFWKSGDQHARLGIFIGVYSPCAFGFHEDVVDLTEPHFIRCSLPASLVGLDACEALPSRYQAESTERA